jgi:hypothetical protein
MSANSEVSCSDAVTDSSAIASPPTAGIDGAIVTHLVTTSLAGHDKNPDGSLGGRDSAGAVIHRIDAAVDALGDVDFATWSDSSLSGHLDELSLVLCRVDAELSRLADAVRSRGFDIAEVDLPLAS